MFLCGSSWRVCVCVVPPGVCEGFLLVCGCGLIRHVSVFVVT